MGFIGSVYYFFTPYTDARERAVGLFFKRLTENSNRKKTLSKLNSLLQQDIAVINLWTEYRYKGYKYLSKSQRKKLYGNLLLIEADFQRFYAQHSSPAGNDKLRLLRALTEYFSPARGLYMYRKSSSFGRLLRDPSRHKLVGDCNQIVTLYMYLYSRYFDVDDLQIRTLPGHVALHFDGIDIETTNGTFVQYGKRKQAALLPAVEIVSINLLDTSDSYLSTHEVDAKDFLQAARFAFLLSNDRDIATNNLKAAYAMLVNSIMKRHNYKQALKIAKHSRDKALLEAVGHNGAVYELQQQNYKAARRFAAYATKRDELTRNSWQAEGVHHYNAHKYHDAIKAFKRSGDQTSVRHSYEALFFEEQSKLGTHLTSETLGNHRGNLKRMRTYAKKSGNKKLVKHADELRKYL